jgi:hypothetical protein
MIPINRASSPVRGDRASAPLRTQRSDLGALRRTQKIIWAVKHDVRPGGGAPAQLSPNAL